MVKHGNLENEVKYLTIVIPKKTIVIPISYETIVTLGMVIPKKKDDEPNILVWVYYRD